MWSIIIIGFLDINAVDAARRLRADSCLLLPPLDARKKHGVHFKNQMTLFLSFPVYEKKNLSFLPALQEFGVFLDLAAPLIFAI